MDLKAEFPNPHMSALKLIAFRERITQKPLAPHDLEHLANLLEDANRGPGGFIRCYSVDPETSA